MVGLLPITKLQLRQSHTPHLCGYASHTKATYLSARFRRLAARKGKKRAIVAVAHSILIILYHVLKTKQPYRELGADYLDRINAAQLKRYFVKRLENLGLQVTVQYVEKAAAPPT